MKIAFSSIRKQPRRSPSPEPEPEAEPEEDQRQPDLDDGEIHELNEELLELQAQLDEMDDDEQREEIMAEIAEVRAAIEERRMFLAEMRRPRVVIQRRSRDIRTSDLRVGVRVIALSGVEGVKAFTNGEVVEVQEAEDTDQQPNLTHTMGRARQNVNCQRWQCES